MALVRAPALMKFQSVLSPQRRCAPFTAKLPCVLQDPEQVHLVTELCSGGDLKQYVEVRVNGWV